MMKQEQISSSVMSVFEDFRDQIENWNDTGNAPLWRKGWNGGSIGMPMRGSAALTGTYKKPTGLNGKLEGFSGFNVFILWAAMQQHGYASDVWWTWKQAKHACRLVGVEIKYPANEHAVSVLRPMIGKAEKLDGTIYSYPMGWRLYSVFNSSVFPDFPAQFMHNKDPIYFDDGHFLTDDDRALWDRLPHADMFIKNIGAIVEHGGDRACYVPSKDLILMPKFEAFHASSNYYATLLHEHVHWSGHKSRLDRLQKFSDSQRDYAFEELVAEFGAAFLCSTLGIVNEDLRTDHVSYLSSWLKLLKMDLAHLWNAASLASKSMNYLQGYQRIAS